jgi:hypothetical protein
MCALPPRAFGQSKDQPCNCVKPQFGRQNARSKLRHPAKRHDDGVDVAARRSCPFRLGAQSGCYRLGRGFHRVVFDRFVRGMGSSAMPFEITAAPYGSRVFEHRRALSGAAELHRKAT